MSTALRAKSIQIYILFIEQPFLENLNHMRDISIPCPHCHSHVKAAKSRTMTDLMKEITYMCQNPDCGYVFIALLEVLRTLTLSSSPNPDIHIELSQHVRQCAANQLALPYKNNPESGPF